MRSAALALVCLCLCVAFDGVRTSGQLEEQIVGAVEKQIVGGNEAKAGEFPFMARIEVSIGEKTECAGAIIDERHILTAAHCVYRNCKLAKPDQVLVKIGCHMKDACDQQSGGAQHLKVQRVMAHVGFRNDSFNDIALLKVDRDMELGKKSGPGAVNCAVVTDFLDPCCDTRKETLIATGWGKFGVPPVEQNQLRKVDLDTISLATCKKSRPSVDKRLICAGDNHKGPCFGDSGGPLLRNIGNGEKYVAVAIFSFMDGNICVSERGAGFTKVANFYYWIERCITGLHCEIMA